MTEPPSDPHRALIELMKNDQRFKFDAYLFVRDGLAYAQDVLKMGTTESAAEKSDAVEVSGAEESDPQLERHLTGQQLCEAIRQHALEQYGYMAKTVLNSWGITTTSDFGDIVYNMIRVGLMKKSESDRREDFNDVFDFDEGFRERFQITMPD